MADRVDQLGAVHGVKMEIGHALVNEVEHLLGGDRGGDQLARRRIVVEPGEAMRQPVGYRGAGAGGEVSRLIEVLHWQNAGHDRDADSAFANLLEITEIEIVLEEELGDGAAPARGS